MSLSIDPFVFSFANRAMGDERAVLELEQAERLPIDLDRERQPLPQFAEGCEA